MLISLFLGPSPPTSARHPLVRSHSVFRSTRVDGRQSSLARLNARPVERTRSTGLCLEGRTNFYFFWYKDEEFVEDKEANENHCLLSSHDRSDMDMGSDFPALSGHARSHK